MLGNLDSARISAAATSLAPPLRVAILCDFLEEQWPSMDIVGEMLGRYLSETCSDAVTATQCRPSWRPRISRVPIVRGKLAANADRLINRFADYPRWLRDKCDDYDLFHLVDHSYAQLLHRLPRGRTVVTCHDLNTFRCVLDPAREVRPRWFRAMARRILDGFRQAAHVIAVSAATRDELLHYGLFPPGRVTVVPNGVHPSCSPLSDPAADAVAASLLPGPRDTVWLLNVGSPVPRKRLDVLLRVFSAIQREIPEVRLLRVGGSFTPAQLQLAAELNVENAVVSLPFLERDVLAAVYRRAALLLHTAEAEGFGLPLIEAMACGRPVVASDIPVLREVGGLATAFCPVADVDGWRDTVVRLLGERMLDKNAWELRRQQGIRHAARFSWSENARQTANIYRKVLAQ